MMTPKKGEKEEKKRVYGQGYGQDNTKGRINE